MDNVTLTPEEQKNLLDNLCGMTAEMFFLVSTVNTTIKMLRDDSETFGGDNAILLAKMIEERLNMLTGIKQIRDMYQEAKQAKARKH